MGWFWETKRHSLAAQGVKTGRKITNLHKRGLDDYKCSNFAFVKIEDEPQALMDIFESFATQKGLEVDDIVIKKVSDHGYLLEAVGGEEAKFVGLAVKFVNGVPRLIHYQDTDNAIEDINRPLRESLDVLLKNNPENGLGDEYKSDFLSFEEVFDVTGPVVLEKKHMRY